MAPPSTVDLTTLQKIIDEKALLWNTSFSVGFYTDELGLQGVAGGPNDRAKKGDRVTPHHRFPVGSVTKPFTAAAILQLHDAGYACCMLRF
jgi:CubicO group peptidase (beta-lactamase class C family)